MRFSTRKKRQPPAVIIVALIDVLIVVLIFLMVTTSFKKPITALKIVLPESTQAAKTGANENPPLIVFIEEKGGLRIGDDARPITMEELKTELASDAAKNPQLRVALSGDKNAPWGVMLKVMDAVGEAHIKIVNAFAKVPVAP